MADEEKISIFGTRLKGKNNMLCDGDCGNVYKEEDLNSTCYGGSLCNDCMCIFLMENETSKEHSE